MNIETYHPGPVDNTVPDWLPLDQHERDHLQVPADCIMMNTAQQDSCRHLLATMQSQHQSHNTTLASNDYIGLYESGRIIV